MKRHVRLTWILVGLTLVIWLVGLVFARLNGAPSSLDDQLTLILLLLYSTVGALVASRYPRNVVGWLLLVGPLGPHVTGLAENYATYVLIARPGALPAGAVAAWLTSWVGNLGFGLLLLFTPLFFPNGRLLSRRWRGVVWLGIMAVVAQAVGRGLRPGPLDLLPIDNPFGLRDATPVLSRIIQIGELVLLVTVVLAMISLILRFRRATGEERQQLKWLAYVGLLVMIVFIASALSSSLVAIPAIVLDAAFLFVVTAFPVSIGIAILKYRLYDIDIIIRRTLIYSTLTFTLGLVYLGCILVSRILIAPLTGASELAIVVSTLAIAALFTPLRRRIQNVIDKRFYRRKYDAAKVLAAFAVTARDETDLKALTAEMLRVVDETMQPAFVGLWLRDPSTHARSEANGKP